MVALLIGFNKIKLTCTSDASNINIYNGDKFKNIKEMHVQDGNIIICLEEEINIKEKTYLFFYNNKIEINYFPLYKTEEFNSRYFYGDSLGAIYSKQSTLFRVWSPAALEVNLLLYHNGDTYLNETPVRIPMHEKNGLFSVEVYKDIKGYFYEYEVTVYGQVNTAVDPYAKAVGINGLRGCVIDLSETDPVDFSSDRKINYHDKTGAVIYEASIRDISINPNSGIKNRGKFLGLSEENTYSPNKVSTGLSHLKELGITHVQLMPIFDISYKSIDEKDPVMYNWGYDPQNFNVPEGSYSTNAYEPNFRIKELKRMIAALHKNNICVVMDVVYNHVYTAGDNNFEKIFPGYYLRLDNNGKYCEGSGCSNDLATENLMMRKFIVDSVYYWATEYHIDGFRFDLMGLIDTDTMKAVEEKLRRLDKNVILYGEGWNMNTYIPEASKSTLQNSASLPKISFFNDTFREAIKGSIFYDNDRGFVNGKENIEEAIKKGVVGSVSYKGFKGIFLSADQSINYASCHDNKTLYDKFQLSNSDYSMDEKINMVKLANSIILTSQGVPFIHSGSDFCRTKNGIENTFNLKDEINCIDYDRKFNYIHVFDYYKGLIKIRRLHPAFMMTDPKMIEKSLFFMEDMPKNSVGFILKDHANNDPYKNIMVIYNANRHPITVSIPHEPWYLCVDRDTSSVEPKGMVDTGKVEVQGISMCLMYNI